MAKVTPALRKHGEKKGKLGEVSLSLPTSYCRQYRYISLSVCTVGIPTWDLLCYLKTVPQVYMFSNLFLWSFLLSSSLSLGNLRSPTWKVKSILKDFIFVVYFNSFRMKKFFHLISTISHTGLCFFSIGMRMWICIVTNKHGFEVRESQLWTQKLTSHLPPTFQGPWEFQGTFSFKVKLSVMESGIVWITQDPWRQQPHSENCVGLTDSLCFE